MMSTLRRVIDVIGIIWIVLLILRGEATMPHYVIVGGCVLDIIFGYIEKRTEK